MDEGQYLKFLQSVDEGCATRFREEPAHDQTLSETDQRELSFIYSEPFVIDWKVSLVHNSTYLFTKLQ